MYEVLRTLLFSHGVDWTLVAALPPGISHPDVGKGSHGSAVSIPAHLEDKSPSGNLGRFTENTLASVRLQPSITPRPPSLLRDRLSLCCCRNVAGLKYLLPA